MDIQRATIEYERWLERHVPLVRSDLREKHRRMRLAPLAFLRGTFYRWCQLWRELAGDVARATRILAVGDLHLENFGTWRDADGRLIWGINDFDEATALPWTQDLVRLTTSAYVAIASHRFDMSSRVASDAILTGYRDGMEQGGRPFVLEEEHGWLRRLAMSELRRPSTFWRKLAALPTARAPDRSARAAISRAMPDRTLTIRFARRIAGMGSLGRPRVVGIADWGGGLVAREAKAMAPSAWLWANQTPGPAPLPPYGQVIARAVRVPDPTVHVTGRWLLRRLAPHCTRIELADLPDRRDEERLLYAMGVEAANVHLGSRRAATAIRRELRSREAGWLHEAAKQMGAAVQRDWKRWRSATASGDREGIAR